MSVYRSKNPYEQSFGYSRAVRRGSYIVVSGTTAIDPETGVLQHPDSAYEQTLDIFREIFYAISQVGGSAPKDIVRVRMFVKRQEDGSEVARAMKEMMDGHVEVAATMICGADFVDGAMLVEIEADAIAEGKDHVD
ncbi:YjgF-like protein [Auriculariales sp. MPI-PUGE-AT-0066]|nr:YjgF-like protein [Auriculariales sp. MPI-PUGE-AT-0066]